MYEDRVFSDCGWTLERLVHVFNSELSVNRRGTHTDYLSLRARLLDGSIICTELSFHGKPRPLEPKRGSVRPTEWMLFRKCSRGGSHLHGWLKWWAYHWLLQQSAAKPKLEQTIPTYGRADLHLPEVWTVVECGNTGPGHALHYLGVHPSGRFIVVPFQRAALENMGPFCPRPLRAFEFTNSVRVSNIAAHVEL